MAIGERRPPHYKTASSGSRRCRTLRSVIAEALALAERQRSAGDLESAAGTLEAAARLDRQRVLSRLEDTLDRLAVAEHGLVFRFVPSGSFLMGNEKGDPDEAPVHRVTLGGFWMSDVPLSWDVVSRILDFQRPPPVPTEKQWETLVARVGESDTRMAAFRLSNDVKIRLQYCENDTTRAIEWYAHVEKSEGSGGRATTSQPLFGRPPRS